MTVEAIKTSDSRLDDAARAAWLYYVGGNTQAEIASKLGISRQSAQRLVSLAMAEQLVKVRIDHPIGHCMDLARRLTERFELQKCEVVPSDPSASNMLTGIGIVAATEIEQVLRRPDEQIIALGTGRTLKASVEQVSRMYCPQHRIVSLLGNMMSDGSATPYNATIAIADRVGARHYPYPMPILAADEEELGNLRQLQSVRHTLELCARADLTLVGIGQLDSTAQILVDGVVTEAEINTLQSLGGVGEICCRPYDKRGRMIESDFSRRIAGAPHPRADKGRLVMAVAVGRAKVPAVRAALIGRLVNGLITDEATAAAILALD